MPIEWIGNNLIKLTSEGEEKFFPVFYEELDLLGLDQFFDYPKAQAPLLWGRDANQYVEYYKDGQLVARIRKGALYKDHLIDYIAPKGLFNNRRLEEIDLKALVSVNEKRLSDLTNEALDYINTEFNRLSEFTSTAIVSYSGGKDSQVVLDLVLQVVPYKQLYVIFTDTKMELPDTYWTFRTGA